MGIQINRLTNANVYLENKSMLGRAQEIQLPVLKQVMSDHQALGMIGKLQFPSGVDKLEGKIMWNAFYEDVYQKFANPYQAIKLMVRSSLETYEGSNRISEKACVCYITCQSNGLPFGTFKQNDNVELENDITITYMKLEVDGILQVEFDAQANIFNVAGTDLLAAYRTNLGI